MIWLSIISSSISFVSISRFTPTIDDNLRFNQHWIESNRLIVIDHHHFPSQLFSNLSEYWHSCPGLLKFKQIFQQSNRSKWNQIDLDWFEFFFSRFQFTIVTSFFCLIDHMIIFIIILIINNPRSVSEYRSESFSFRISIPLRNEIGIAIYNNAFFIRCLFVCVLWEYQEIFFSSKIYNAIFPSVLDPICLVLHLEKRVNHSIYQSILIELITILVQICWDQFSLFVCFFLNK